MARSFICLPPHLKPGEVITYAYDKGGVLDTGCYPQGIDALGERINADLREAGFAATADAHIMRKKYAKLLRNLGNILQAALKEGEPLKDVGKALRDEALACYAAAGIECTSRDEYRGSIEGAYTMQKIPGYARAAGSSWQSMQRGRGDIETEFLNGEICLLGRLHEVPTPMNNACVRLARDLVLLGRGPGQFTVEDLRSAQFP